MAVLAAMPRAPIMDAQNESPNHPLNRTEKEKTAFSMAAVLVERSGVAPRVKRVKSSPQEGSLASVRGRRKIGVRREESLANTAIKARRDQTPMEGRGQSELGRTNDIENENIAKIGKPRHYVRPGNDATASKEIVLNPPRPSSLESLGFSELTLRSSTDTSTSSLRAQRTNSGSRPRRRTPQEVADFHRESCQLFQSFSAPASRRNSIVGSGAQVAKLFSEDGNSIISSPVNITIPGGDLDPELFQSLNLTTIEQSRCSTPEAIASPIAKDSQQDAGPILRRFPPTTIDWTSDETRRKEYEKIDRSWSGIRGIWKRATPRWCHHRNSRPGFYKGSTDDTGSVRRFRIDLSEDEVGLEDSRPRAVPAKLARWWTSL